MQDELKNLLNKAKTANKQEKVVCYLKIALIYQNQKQQTESLKYFKRALRIAKSNQFTELIAKSYFLIAKYYMSYNVYDKSIRNFLSAEQFYKTLKAEKELSAIYHNLGIIYWKMGNYADSLENFYLSIKKKKIINDEIGISECYNNLGLVYWKLNNSEKALECLFISLEIKEKNHLKDKIPSTLNNIGNIYYDKKDIEKTLYYHKKAYELSKDIDNITVMANSLNNIGVDYKKLRKYKEALKYLFKSLQLKWQIPNDTSIANTYKNIGKVFKLQRRYDRAIKYFQKALKSAKESNSKLVLRDCFSELSDIYEKRRDFKVALDLKKKYIEVLESIFKETNNKKISELEVKISVEHMLQKTEIIKQKNIELEHEISERKKTEETLKSYREHLEMINRILRHDIMNKLAIMQSSVRLFNRSKDKKYLDSISESVQQTSNLIYRMKNLESYLLSHSDLKIMDLSQVLKEVVASFPDKEINVFGKGKVFADEALNSVFENLIFNAFKHGKIDKIDIKIELKNDFYVISVIDFGVGIPDNVKDKIFNKNYVFGKSGNTGLGLYIVKQSIERYGGKITVADNKPNGTIFKFSLKAIK